MKFKKLGLTLVIASCLSGNVFADDVDDEIQRLEKEKKRLELKKEVESMQNADSKKTANDALNAKVEEAVAKAQKPLDPNDFSHKNDGIFGLGLGFLAGSLTAEGSANGFTPRPKYDAGGFNISMMAGTSKFFTKMHGIRYYFDANIGVGGDSYAFTNSYSGADKSWILFNMGGSVDYLIDFMTINMLGSPWNLGAFVGINAGVGMNMPYASYYDASYNYKQGYTYAHSFWGLAYGFQFGVTLMQDKAKASGLEIGYKYRVSGGSGTWSDVGFDNVKVNYSGGIIYANYIYRM